MKYILTTLFSLSFINAIFCQDSTTTSSIEIRIDNIAHDKGMIAISIFKGEDGFPMKHEKAIQAERFMIDMDSPVFIFDNIPPGEYALSVMHDENSNLKLDTNFLGIPKEAYAVSNNVKPRTFGPPKYEDAVFEHGTSKSTLKLSLLY